MKKKATRIPGIISDKSKAQTHVKQKTSKTQHSSHWPLTGLSARLSSKSTKISSASPNVDKRRRCCCFWVSCATVSSTLPASSSSPLSKGVEYEGVVEVLADGSGSDIRFLCLGRSSRNLSGIYECAVRYHLPHPKKERLTGRRTI